MINRFDAIAAEINTGLFQASANQQLLFSKAVLIPLIISTGVMVQILDNPLFDDFYRLTPGNFEPVSLEFPPLF